MIIDYLKESLLFEARFELVKPQDYKFYGIEGLEVDIAEDDSLLVHCIAPYIFAFDENLFDMVIETTMIYPAIKNDLGFIRYDTYGVKVKPVYVDPNGEEYDLTDNIIKTNEQVQAFLKSSQLIVNVDLDFNFDLSEHDPSYDSSQSFETLDSGKPADVFRKLNNVAYILKDYVVNFDKYTASKIESKIFGAKYKTFVSLLRYQLNMITFSGKQDYEGDMRRTNVYKKWFGSIVNEYGHVVNTKIDGIDFEFKYDNTVIA